MYNLDTSLNTTNTTYHNQVSTCHDMNYGQVRYLTLIDKIKNITKAEPFFGTWSKNGWTKKSCKSQWFWAVVQREKKCMAYDLHPVFIPYLVSQNS